MTNCLGIYVEDNLIKYAKVSKDSENIKLDAYGIKFYDDLQKSIEQIVNETYSFQVPLSINIKNENYTYSNIFTLLSKRDFQKAVATEFEYFCSDTGNNKNALEFRTIESPSPDLTDRTSVMYVYTDKSNIIETTKSISNSRIVNVSPIAVTIPDISKFKNKENSIIVNIENQTEITTISNTKIVKVKKIETGMATLLKNIAQKENSEQKAYEICKNTTIYTKIGQNLQVEPNPYLEDIITILYEIIQEVKKVISENEIEIDNIYITGLGVVINNIDLFFQENFIEKKCEILTPFFVNKANIKINIKDYIEVNSAIALALHGLEKNMPVNFQAQKMNFNFGNIMDALNKPVNLKSGKTGVKTKISINNELNGPLDMVDKILLRLIALVMMVIIIYSVFVKIAVKKIETTTVQMNEVVEDTNAKITDMKTYSTQVNNKISEYQKILDKLKAAQDKATLADSSQKIPNLLYEVMFAIPEDVQILSIENTSGNHIKISAQAKEYPQLGYFKAILSTKAILINITMTAGEKQNNVITVTIEGDLP